MIVVFIGKLQSGKTTAANHLIVTYGFTRVSFGDKLKEFASEIFGIPLEDFYNPEAKIAPLGFVPDPSGPYRKPITPRLVLQHFGTEGCRYLDTDVWVKWVENGHFKTTKSRGKKYVIDDCRFPNEQEMLRKHGAKFIKIVRPGYEGDSHASETEQESLEWDDLIDNSGSVEDLWKAVDTIMRGM